MFCFLPGMNCYVDECACFGWFLYTHTRVSLKIKVMKCVFALDILLRETTLNKIVLPSFLNGIYSKRKEFAPKGSKFFLSRVDLFTEGTCCVGEQIVSHKICLPLKKWQTVYQLYSPNVFLARKWP